MIIHVFRVTKAALSDFGSFSASERLEGRLENLPKFQKSSIFGITFNEPVGSPDM